MDLLGNFDEPRLVHPTGAKRVNLQTQPDVYEGELPASSLALQEQIEKLLERYRGEESSPSQLEINNLYTDGCAVVLALETERLRVKRRMTAAALDSVEDPEAAQEAASLALRGDELIVELAKLKALVRQLRAAVDYAQDEESAGPPRRRFRRV